MKMIVNVSNNEIDSNCKLCDKRIIAERNGFQLYDKHILIHLHSWIDGNEAICSNDDMEEIVCRLVERFNRTPASTIIELESYAKQKFSKSSKLLSGI